MTATDEDLEYLRERVRCLQAHGSDVSAGRIQRVLDELLELREIGFNPGYADEEPAEIFEEIHTWEPWPMAGVLCGEYPGSKDGSNHKVDLLVADGVTAFVDLTHPDDKLTPYTVPEGVEVYRHPIPDRSVISQDGYDAIIDWISSRPDDSFYLHCWGGFGRTGTVAAMYMAKQFKSWGVPYDAETIFRSIDISRSRTRKAHQPAPQNEVQRTAVRTYIERLDS